MNFATPRDSAPFAWVAQREQVVATAEQAAEAQKSEGET